MGWTFETTVGLVALLTTWPLALFVFLSAPGRASNQILGAILLLEGIGVAGLRMNDIAPTLSAAVGMSATATVAIFALPPLYLLLLGVALDGPLTRPFRTMIGRAILALCFVASFPVTVLWTDDFLGRAVITSGGYYFPATPASRIIVLVFAAVVLYNLVATLVTLLSAAKGTIARSRARLFAIAFGTRDAVLIPVLVYTAYAAADGPVAWVFPTGLLVVALAYPPLLAYALLRHQLFDIDLRIKRLLSRGSLATLFVAVFVIASQLGQAFAQRTFGGDGWMVGAVAAGLLVFALTPLQRTADRIAHRAMPNVTGTDEYLAFKKLEVYRAAVEGIATDGEINSQERTVLDRLMEKLGVAPIVASRVERDVLDQTAGTVS